MLQYFFWKCQVRTKLCDAKVCDAKSQNENFSSALESLDRRRARRLQLHSTFGQRLSKSDFEFTRLGLAKVELGFHPSPQSKSEMLGDQIRRPLERGAIRLRRSESILYRLSCISIPVSLYIYPVYYILYPGSPIMDTGLGLPNLQIHHHSEVDIGFLTHPKNPSKFIEKQC